MKIPISKAKAKLSALVNTALAGEEVILTKHGRPVAEIRPLLAGKKGSPEKLSALRRIVVKARNKRLDGVAAAEADNFLYDDDTGLPS